MTKHTAILWNVERLFRNPKSIVARTLGGTKRVGWSLRMYRRKVRAVGEVLRAICPDGPPALLALIEVESGTVVREILRAAGWTGLVDVTVPGEDVNGYDLALAYSTKLFEPDGDASSYNIQARFTTRDILEVPLRTRRGGHPLRVVHTHWPSRKITADPALRLSAADYCSRLIERHLKLAPEEVIKADGRASLPSRATLERRWNTPVLVTGDFNDSPYDPSLAWLVASTRDAAAVTAASRLPNGRGRASAERYLTRQPRLYNPSWRLLTEPPKRGTRARATTYYGGEWLMFDQILCSRGLLLPGPGVRFVEGSLRIFGPKTVGPAAKPTIVTNGSGAPLAFDRAKNKGVSDHLPLVWELEVP